MTHTLIKPLFFISNQSSQMVCHKKWFISFPDCYHFITCHQTDNIEGDEDNDVDNDIDVRSMHFF